MTAAGKLSYLPVSSPIRTAVSKFNLLQSQPGAQHKGQHRIFRLPPRERPDIFSYYPNGHAAAAPVTGAIVDLYA